MSRNATSTPPAPYFPQRTATPTMRHATLPNFDQSRFSFRSPHHQPQPRRKAKPLPTPGGDSFEADDQDLKWRNTDDVATGAWSEQGISEVLVADAESPAAPVLVSPTKSWMPNLGRMAKAVVSSGMSMGMSLSGMPKDRPATAEAKPITETSRAAAAPPPSAVFQPRARYTRPPEHLLASLSLEARQRAEVAWQDAEHKRVTECARLCSQWPQSGYHISKYGPQGARVQYEPQSSAHPEHVQAVMQRQAMMELYMTQHGFNFWPASESPRSSTSLAPSDDDDENSEPGLTDSSLPSPASSILLSADESLSAITTARLKAAMASPLIGGLDDSRASSQVSLISQISGVNPVVCNSLGDLDVLASTMALSATEPMDVDSESGSVILSTDRNSSSKSVDGDSSPAIVTRSARAQSCGAKRPLFMPTEDNQKTEEDKRRKVDEEMVVEEAIETGVMQPAQRVSPAIGMTVANRMSASAPDLSAVRAQSQAAQPSVFGHVVKTSDTHPIIISLFIPPELLATLAQNLLLGGPNSSSSARPPILSSAIDVPLLLLSHASSQQQQRLSQLDGLKVAGQVAPVPTASVGRSGDKLIGNVMLSSCPGKRLRMDGPVKGRGPVFRDLATDLRRIKNEGVGALVCCLDDAELALLGVPWESYRDVASSLGLDIIRLPMPDGFTPVSLEHFDEHVSRIVDQYTLRGVNVLIHCRGGVGRAGLTACAWAIKMGFVQPHPSLAVVEAAATRHAQRNPGAGVAGAIPAELEHQIVMSITERVIAMIRSRRGLKAIESFEQVQFLVCYVKWLRARARANTAVSAPGATA